MSMLDEALRFAIAAHEGMVRKGDGTPYVLHPLEVVCIVATMTDDEEALCAAALHDVVEDTQATIEDVRAAFGGRVADLVAGETEDKRPDMPRGESWSLRKRESVARLRASDDPATMALWVGDKLSNARSLARLCEREGDAAWEHFNQRDPRCHAWYYRAVLEATCELSHTSAWQELERLVSEVFGGIDSREP